MKMACWRWLPILLLGMTPLRADTPDAGLHAPIPVRFTLPDDGEVTLVVEDATGKRVRNLVSQQPFPKGENVVWWDGADDLARDRAYGDHGIYDMPVELVAPGAYTVRGLWHKPIDPRYEFSVYSPGNPPWPTKDGTGGWMTNHTPAWCALFVPGDKAPGGKPFVCIGSPVSEGGSAVSWVDLDGKKFSGRGWIGGAWTGASYMTRNAGPQAVPGIYAYVATMFVGNKKYGIDGKIEIRLTGLTSTAPTTDSKFKGDKPVLTPAYTLDPPDAGKDAMQDVLGGLAAYNGMLAVSQPLLNKLLFVDAKQGKVAATFDVPSPRGVAYDAQGRLLVLSAHSLLRYALPSPVPAEMPPPETLVSGLDSPSGITLDDAGTIYVSDQGASNQVKTFSADGKPGLVYGKAGPLPLPGPYDPLRMHHPKGLAVDSNGRLWVAEDDFVPKRVSVWNPDGTLWKTYLGPAQYGGGGIIDSKDKTRFFYDGMEFHLDWDKGDSSLARIYYHEGPDTLKLAFRAAPPEAPAYFHGRRYLSDSFNSNGTNGHDTCFLFLDKDDGAVPVAGIGRAAQWDLLKDPAFASRWPAGIAPTDDQYQKPSLFLWSDLNGDGKPQPEEVTIVPGRVSGIVVGDDGSFLVSSFITGAHGSGGHALRFPPARFTDRNVPVYALPGQEIAPGQNAGSDGGNQVVVGTDGWLVQTTPPPPFSNYGIGGSHNGTPQWSYPSLWPGLHPSHNAPVIQDPGVLVGTTRLLGGLVTGHTGEGGPLFFLNCNQGSFYAFTQDGLFVSQIFHDMRTAKMWQMPESDRDMAVGGLTLHDENFFPSVTGTPDGKIYAFAGGIPAIVRLDGFDTIRRIAPFPVTVSADDLKKAQQLFAQREIDRQAEKGTGVLTAPLLDAVPSGPSDAWKGVAWVPIDQRGKKGWFNSNAAPYNVTATLAVADGKLVAAWRTGDPGLLANSGAVPNGLFKTGGALDLMLGADSAAAPDRPAAVAGDERLLVARVGGKTRALLYRAVVPGTSPDQKVPFRAPWHEISLDKVDDVSDQVQLADDGQGNYQVTVPLPVLGLAAQQGTKIKGDIGILRGDGQETTQRVYWTNKGTAIVSDVPTEAELTPRLWGTIEFK